MRGIKTKDRTAISQSFSKGTELRIAVRSNGEKLVVNSESADPLLPPAQLFSVDVDPMERENRINEQSNFPQHLEIILEARREDEAKEGSPHFGRPKDMPSDLEERLESLGYLE